MQVDHRGIVLTENVDLNWLNQLTPRFHPDYVKFVINVETNRVAVGMDIHADAELLLGDKENLYGGNIYRDGSIIYQSTLNIEKNLKNKEEKEKSNNPIKKIFLKKKEDNFNPRIITDPELIGMINAVLFAWVEI